LTCEEYLDRQEKRARQSIAMATKTTGDEVKTVIDVPAMVRRRPALSLGAGVAAGFVVGSMLHTNTRRVTRGAFRAVWAPLLRPTLTTFGSALAEILVGSPSHPSE
jgi:hypothetical protein